MYHTPPSQVEIINWIPGLIFSQVITARKAAMPMFLICSVDESGYKRQSSLLLDRRYG